MSGRRGEIRDGDDETVGKIACGMENRRSTWNLSV
jgi:hypothetical protein